MALTSRGRDGQEAHRRRVADVEHEWQQRFDPDVLEALRSTLQSILDEPGGDDGPLTAGLVTPPRGWRATGRYKPLTAAVVDRPRDSLPDHPMVLHRGGWPDGS